MEDFATDIRQSRFLRNKTEDISNLLYGKIPPQARELEEAVLGAVMVERDAINEIIDILKPEMFYVDAHRTIFTSIVSLHSKSQPIDLLTLTEDLKTKAKLEEIGGAYSLSELTNKVASSANIEYHARIIIQKFIQRELIRISNDIIRDSYEDTTDVFELLSEANDRLLSLNNINVTGIRSVAEIERKIRKSLITKEPIAKLYKIGIDDIDFMSKTFNVIGGYPGTGKTAFMLTGSQNLEKQGYKVGIFSIEMSNEMLVARMIQSKNSISAKRIITNGLSESEIEQILFEDPLTENILIDDSTDLNDKNILIKAKAFIIKYDLDFLWIDFMQILEIMEKKILEVRVMENISRGLQNIAKDMDKCIVALSQLSKTKDNEKPTYNNIRGGGLEQASSDILLMFDKYAKENDGVKWMDIPFERRGILECIYAKGRYSEVNNKMLYFDKPKQIITAWNKKPEMTMHELNNKKQDNKTEIF